MKPFPTAKTINRLLIIAIFGCQLVQNVLSYKICSTEDGGGICPDHNTCCATGTPGVSSCISAKPGEEAACCLDDGQGLTGCGTGYECMSNKTGGNLRRATTPTRELYCHRIDPNYNDTKPKPAILPRYQLCTVPQNVLTQVFGLPVRNNPEESVKRELANVAYFSTMGSLNSKIPADLQNHQRVTTVFIVVHGSGRTAGNYLYGAVSSLPEGQKDPQNATIMVIAPWFLDPDDDDVNSHGNQSSDEDNEAFTNAESKQGIDKPIPVPLPPRSLRWIEESPIVPHTWRYGANAINSTISSFAAVDRMVEQLVNDPVKFPSLQNIVVSGHSAGGQFVQRWALLSNSPVWNNAYYRETQQRHVSIRVVPANPRCFAFLDDRRFVKDPITNATVFERPGEEAVGQCPSFNEWIWGLEAGGNVSAPYKDQAIADAGGAKSMAYRYVTQRRLVYLAGGEDLQVFEDDCGSVIQGKTRRERSHHFMSSLLEAYPEEMKRSKRHTRLLVPGVPHDHMLMFQSSAGQQALFGGDEHNTYDEDLQGVF